MFFEFLKEHYYSSSIAFQKIKQQKNENLITSKNENFSSFAIDFYWHQFYSKQI